MLSRGPTPPRGDRFISASESFAAPAAAVLFPPFIALRLSREEPLWQSDMSKDYEQSGDRRNKRNASESLQKNGRYRKGVEREHFAIAVKQMESSQMSRSVSRIRAAYRSLRDHRTRIRAGRNLAAMEDAFLKDIGISRAEIHYSVDRGSRHGPQGAALLSA